MVIFPAAGSTFAAVGVGEAGADAADDRGE
jgi:hypothetical protein